MSDIRQDIDFTKSGLNSDDSDFYTPIGDSPYFLNVMVGEDGSVGVLTNMKGNEQIAYTEPLTLSNAYFVLGSYYNNLTRKNYFFLFGQPYESGGQYYHDNRLLCYNEDTGLIDTIFRDIKNWFELDPAKHLTDCKMIESWLFFNPVTAQPKMIDVDMAYNYTNYPAFDATDPSFSAHVGEKFTWYGGLFVANATITAGQSPSSAPTKWDRIGDAYQNESTIGITDFQKAFYAIKVPPVDRLSVAYGSDSTKNFNNVRGVAFRFCHRYQYFDNSYSVCSSHSDLALPVNDEAYNGELAAGLTTNNYIALTFSLGSSALIKGIEIFFQDIGGDWKRASLVNRRDQTLLNTVNYTYKFYNEDTYPTIEQTLPGIIYDAVPKLTQGQEIINKNVLCFAGCTEGFDNIDKDKLSVELTPEMVSIDTEYDINTLRRDNVVSHDLSYELAYDAEADIYTFITKIDVLGWFSGASVAALDIYSIVLDGKRTDKELVAGDVDTCLHLMQAMAYAVGNAYGDGVTVGKVYIYGYYKYPEVSVSKIYKPTTSIGSLTKKGGFKTGAYHPFCLFYYDSALRRSDAQISSDMTVYVPSVNDYSPVPSTVDVRWKMSWAINHEPMAGMSYWQWGYAGNSRCAGNFTQYIIASIADGSADVSNTVKVDITPLQTIRTTSTTNWNCFPNSTIPNYVFNTGDRIRFVTEKTTPLILYTLLGDPIDGICDYEILKFDDTTNMLYVKTFDYGAVNIGENTLVEIYTPTKKTQVQTYYTFGNIMPIVKDADGNIVHGGQIQNQDLSASPLPATGVFNYGDVYHIMRTPSKPLSTFNTTHMLDSAFHETPAWSDFYDSDDWDRGKLGLESAIGEVYVNFIRYGSTFLQNTQINGLTTFPANQYKELNDVYGRIMSIIEVGDTLKCYQEKKAASIQIGRTEYYDTGGATQNVQTQAFVLGSIRYAIPNYGTIYPESLVKNNRYVYGFDIYNGLVFRDSANGIFPISGRYSEAGAGSDYKMQTYFKKKAKALLASGKDYIHVMGVWDEEFKMYYLTFKDLVNTDNDETIVFHEPSDRWITFTEFYYTPQGGWNQFLELTYEVVKGFDNGIGYSFDKESRFAVFNIGGGVGTSPNVNLSAIAMEYAISQGTPVVEVDNPESPSFLPLSVSLGTPTVTITSLALSVGSMSWAASEYGISQVKTDVVTIVGSSSCFLSSIPSWITVVEVIHNTPLSVGSTLTSGQTIGIYPSSINTGSSRNGSVIIGDATGNTASVSVAQAASATNPIVTVSVDPAETGGLVLYEASGTATNGVSVISITFTPDLPAKGYNEDYTLYYSIFKNSVSAGGGSFLKGVNGVRDERSNTKSVTMSSNAGAGDNIVVYLTSTHLIIV